MSPCLSPAQTLILPLSGLQNPSSLPHGLKPPDPAASQVSDAGRWHWNSSQDPADFDDFMCCTPSQQEYVYSSSEQSTGNLQLVCIPSWKGSEAENVCLSKKNRTIDRAYVRHPSQRIADSGGNGLPPSNHATNLDVVLWPSLQHTTNLELNASAWPPLRHVTNLDEDVLPPLHSASKNLDCLSPPLHHMMNSDPHSCVLDICKEESLDRVRRWLWFLHKEDIVLHEDAISSLLQRCINESHIECGRQVLLFMISNGLDIISFLDNCLIRLFISCESLKEACVVFRRMDKPTVHSWHFIILGYTVAGENALAFSMLHKMKEAGIEPNTFVFTSLLKACGNLGDIGRTQMIHNQIIVEGVDLDVFMGSALVYAYAACNRLDEARKVFDELGVRNVVCWNTMLEAYAKNGYGASAISLFKEMYTAGIKPDRITFMSVLKACGMVGASKYGVNIHLRAIESGLESSIHVRTALIDMYAKCGRLNEACRNFQKLLHYDVVSCGAMMAGYIQHGDHVCALRMFDKMEAGGIKPDSATFSCALQACGSLGAFQRGKRLHKQAMRSGQVDMMMISTIIDMYARCGDVDEAQEVLDAWPHSGIASWGAMIKGYALHGNFSRAQHTFERMEERGIKPNEMIYTCIIAACCHAVKVREGQKYFVSMRDSYMTPTIEHFGCMVDLLARAGKLCEAQELLECMPIPPDVKSWMALLTGCRKHENVVLGRRCFDQVVRLDPSTATGYQIMMETYAHSKMWGCISEIRELRKCANAWRKPGKAWIEVNNKIHEFVVGDKTHPECEKIYGVLHRMREAMEKEGYVPGTDLVFEPTMTTRDKEDALCGHSEKLALAFGLLSSPPGSTIRVSKNLRMCNDCHSACKIVSRIEKRRIIVSDEYCVHHFKDGVCLCGDC